MIAFCSKSHEMALFYFLLLFKLGSAVEIEKSLFRGEKERNETNNDRVENHFAMRRFWE